jgi:hypothetical protein
MATHAQNSTVTPANNIGFRGQPYGTILAVVGGLVLLGFALYILMLVQRIGARLEALPKMEALLVTTNDRLATVSAQLDAGDTNMKQLPPLLRQVNENVRQLARPLSRVNANVQGTSPTLRRMDSSLNLTNQRLSTVQQKLEQKLDGLRQPMERMEETTRRMRKILPRP